MNTWILESYWILHLLHLTTDDISGTEAYAEEMASDEVQEKFAKLGRIKIPTALSEGDIKVPSSSGDESSKILKELKHKAKHKAKKRKKQNEEEKRKRDNAAQKKKEKRKKL